MSTQRSSFPAVPFSITRPQQNFRLVELPPDLVELLSSHDRPATLQLKSVSLGKKQAVTKPQNEYLHLCTNDKVWALRQVSTSNSVYITSPTSPASRTSPPDADTMALDELPSSGTAVTAISQPTSSLELIPIQVTPATANDAVRTLLPTHPIPNNDNDGYLDREPSTHDIESLYSDLLLPQNILRPAIRNLFVFETRNPSGNLVAYVPSDLLLLQSWRRFYNTYLATTEKGKDLTTFDVRDAAAITTAICQDGSEGAIYACVVNAVMERFVQLELEGGAEEEQTRARYANKGKLKGKDLSIWLGQLMVRCVGEAGVAEDELTDQWMDLLPTAWAEYCFIAALGEQYPVLEGKVRWLDPETAQASASATAAEGGGGVAVAAGKRNWHETFARGR